MSLSCIFSSCYDQEVSPEDLSRDLKEIRQYWYTFGKHLKIPFHRLKEISDDHNTTEQRFDAVLQDYHQRETSPSVGKLISALEQCDLNRPAHKMREKYSGSVRSVAEFVYNEYQRIQCVECCTHLGYSGDHIETKHNQTNEFSYKHTRVNPYGYEHIFVTFKRANDTNLHKVSLPTSEHTWFTGYQWTILNCAGCKKHKGWFFEKTDNNSRDCGGQSFYGLLTKGYTLA